MKITLLLILVLLPLLNLAQGKFDSEAPFHRLNSIEIPKEKKKKYKTRKLRKINKGPGNKITLKTAFRMDAFFLNTRNSYDLEIAGDRVFYEGNQVGNYSFSRETGKFQNVAHLQQGENVYWNSNEMPSEYKYESSLNHHTVFGGSIEWRFLRKDRMGPPSGFFINTGVLLINKPVSGLNIQENEILLPIGLGFIIPGDERLRVEITTNAVVGNNGSAGIKFDFSFVYQDLIKFGPGFIYTQNTEMEGSKASGLGLHFGVLMPKLQNTRRTFR